MRLSLDQPRPGGPIRGTGRIQPMRVGNSRLALGDDRLHRRARRRDPDLDPGDDRRAARQWLGARAGDADRRPPRRPRRLRLRGKLHPGAVRGAPVRHPPPRPDRASALPDRPGPDLEGARRPDRRRRRASLAPLRRNARRLAAQRRRKPPSLRPRRPGLHRLGPRGPARRQPARPRLAHRRFRQEAGSPAALPDCRASSATCRC